MRPPSSTTVPITGTQALSRLAKLFENHPSLPAIQQAVLEGRMGRALANDDARPTAARLDLGCYAIVAGDAEQPGADGLILGVRAKRELVYAEDGWRRRILSLRGDEVRDRPMEGFSAAGFDLDHLEGLARKLAPGHRMEPLSAETVHQLDRGLEPHGLQAYESSQDFLAHGMSWGVFHEPTQRLVSTATSYALSSQYVEVAISTHADHRGAGLATTVAARFCLDALERGLEPCWNAANPVSKRLALRLGFQPSGTSQILFVEET